MATLHVWKISPNPAPPYANKQTGAHTIAKALAAAAAGDTIIVHGDCAGGARCVYLENVVVNLAGIKLLGREWPIVDGGRNGRCVDFVSRSPKLSRLDRFEIRNGLINNGNGGGVRVHETSVKVTRNCIHHNQAQDGGGVAVERRDNLFVVSVDNNEIHHNDADSHGGGVAVIGDDRLPGARPSVLIHKNLIHHNRAGRGGGNFIHGGGISVYRDRASISSNDIFENSTAGVAEHQGGGVAVFNVDEGRDTQLVHADLFSSSWTRIAIGQVRLKANHIHDNRAHDGGGVSGLWAASIIYVNNLIENNNATDDGGGIYGSVVAHHGFGPGNKIYENTAVSNGGGVHITCSSRVQFSGGNIIEGNTATRGHGGGISVRNGELACSAVLHVKDNTAGNKGGGIFVWTAGLGRLIFIPCEMDSLMELSGALVEGNTAGGIGGGICVDKDEYNVRTNPTRIARSVIRANVSTGSRYSGVAFLTSDPNYDPVIQTSIIENHTNPGGAVGVYSRGTPSNKIGIRIGDSIIRNNEKGFEGRYVENGWIVRSYFQTQAVYQVQLRNETEIFAQRNFFDGGTTTRDGVRSFVGGAAVPGRYTNNTITGHTRFGMASATAIQAPNNWWGNVAGPTVQGGAVNQGADVVTPTVAWKPPLGAAPIFGIPGVQVPTPPTAVTLSPPTFTMPSEYFPDLDCTGLGAGGGTPPSTPDSRTKRIGYLPFPRGTFEVDEPVGRLTMSNSEIFDAIITPDSAIILDDGGVAIAVISEDGEWQGIGYQSKSSAEVGGEACEEKYLTRLSMQPDEISLPSGYIEIFEDDGPILEPADFTVQVWPPDESGKKYMAIIRVDGWPLLVCKVNDTKELSSMGELVILVSENFSKVSVRGNIGTNVEMFLQLPALGPNRAFDKFWATEESNDTETFAKPTADETQYLPDGEDTVTPIGMASIVAPDDLAPGKVSVLRISRFKGGELQLIRSEDV